MSTTEYQTDTTQQSCNGHPSRGKPGTKYMAQQPSRGKPGIKIKAHPSRGMPGTKYTAQQPSRGKPGTKIKAHHRLQPINQAEAENTNQNDNNNERIHATKRYNGRSKGGHKAPTVMSPRKDVLQTHWPLVTGLLLPITLLLTTLTTSLLQTWTAPLLPATAVQWLVTKVEKDGYFDAEVFNEHNATEFRRDETHLTWDV